VPFVIAGFALVAALIYGGVGLYGLVAGAFGALAGTAAVMVAAALLVAFGVALMRRYRAVHGVKVAGERVVAASGTWGAIRIDAERKRGTLSVDERKASFLFADIAGARAVSQGGAWALVLSLEHNAQAEWILPIGKRADVDRWVKIVRLAAEQKL
jgi:hypothetical protein